jgi:unspecific monooxygenase
MPTIIILGCIIGLLFSYKFFVLPVLSPLSKIPNAHITTPFSNAWILWQRYRSTENRAIHDSHRRLGPIVRLGPTEISVNSLEGLRTIYGDNLDKHEWYCGAFENYGYAIKAFETQLRSY